jgi:hypothetical protein
MLLLEYGETENISCPCWDTGKPQTCESRAVSKETPKFSPATARKLEEWRQDDHVKGMTKEYERKAERS